MLDDQERQQRGHNKTYEERKHLLFFRCNPAETSHCTGLALGNPDLSSVRARAPLQLYKYEIAKL
jgi:hypothetical protein